MSHYMRRKRMVAALVLALSGTAAASAEDAQVLVTVDRAKVFRIEEAASTVIVGNPSIADVAMHDRYTVVVTGKSYGTTNLVILDATSEPIIDEVIVVKPSETDLITVTRNTARQSYSCSPRCEPTLRVGDNDAAFKITAEQAATRNEIAVTAANPTN